MPALKKKKKLPWELIVEIRFFTQLGKRETPINRTKKDSLFSLHLIKHFQTVLLPTVRNQMLAPIVDEHLAEWNKTHICTYQYQTINTQPIYMRRVNVQLYSAYFKAPYTNREVIFPMKVFSRRTEVWSSRI